VTFEAPQLPLLAEARSRRPVAWLRWGFTLLLLALLAVLLHEVNLARVLEALGRADARLVAAAALINLTLNTVARVCRKRTMLESLPRPGDGVGFGELVSLFFAGFAGNNLLPARAGDVLLAVQLNRRHRYPLGSLAAAHIGEKAIEILSLWIVALPVALLVRPLKLLSVPFYGFVAAGFCGFAALLSLSRRPSAAAPPRPLATAAHGGAALASLRQRLSGFGERWTETFAMLRAPRVWARALGWSCVSDGFDLAMIGLCLAAVGISASLAVWGLVLVVVNIAISVPSTPGQLGTLEAGAVGALAVAGVPQSEALAFALLYHAAHFVPITLVGLFELRRFR
jgi:uncharacterized membrane protein YbhN (UPF0104 family)